MKYDLHTALREDIDAGAVWIGSPTFESRTIAQIRNVGSRKSAFCEVKMIDSFFLKLYAERTNRSLADSTRAIFVSAWYRKRLGISGIDGVIELEITRADSVIGKIRACLHHPQVVVRIATWLGIWSVLLGVIGLALGVVSMLPKKPNQAPEPTPMSVTPPAAQEPRQP